MGYQCRVRTKLACRVLSINLVAHVSLQVDEISVHCAHTLVHCNVAHVAGKLHMSHADDASMHSAHTLLDVHCCKCMLQADVDFTRTRSIKHSCCAVRAVSIAWGAITRDQELIPALMRKAQLSDIAGACFSIATQCHVGVLCYP